MDFLYVCLKHTQIPQEISSDNEYIDCLQTSHHSIKEWSVLAMVQTNFQDRRSYLFE